MGTTSEGTRAAESQKLLTYGFRYYTTTALYTAGESLNKVRVWGGTHSSINLGLEDDIVVTVPRGARDNLTAQMDMGNEIHAPLQQGQQLGTLTVSMDGKEIARVPLIALNAVEEAGFFSQLWDAISLFFLQLLGGDPLAL